ncbi:hypothetical protein [Mycolicibacterium palauense]|uniref:hypothetical protein n=1 Tax=Mycolicibacterium palauense TaxID=2034511 RepID=UPI000BFEBC1F|nr:hypothetical protein [Mycolicibacterium palauense]
MSDISVLIAEIQHYLQAIGQNVSAPMISSDMVITGTSPLEQALAILNLAANASDPQDNTTATTQQAERSAGLSGAAAGFAANEEQSAAQLGQVAGEGGQQVAQQGADQASQMAQQIPQMISGLAGGIAGALGGAMQPLMQIPQQLGQAAQGLMQTGMGAMQQMGGTLAAEPIDQAALDAAGLDPYGADLGEGAGGGGGSAGGGGGGTSPSAMLGPPATPIGGTVPTAGRAAALAVAPAAAAQTTAPMMGGGGMGMIPPGMMHGLAGQGGGEGKDAKTDTKRVVPPTVRNGAPIQGRLTVPPTPPVTKNENKTDDEVKPIATRRIIVPGPKSDGPDKSGT